MYRDILKPLLDGVAAFFGLIVLSPIFLLIILLQLFFVGKPFFSQKRIGKDGRVFTILKFRSMTDQKDVNGNYFPDEMRITKFGKLLRRSSLDELPQLINVLKGEMSLVGPRPLPVYYGRLFSAFQQRRNCVKPGITGLAQASGGNLITWYSRFRLDVCYSQNVSFCLDIKIMYKTIKFIFSQKRSMITDVPLDFTGNPLN